MFLKVWSKDIITLKQGRRVPFGDESNQEPVGAPGAATSLLQQSIFIWLIYCGAQLKESSENFSELLTRKKEWFV